MTRRLEGAPAGCSSALGALSDVLAQDLARYSPLNLTLVGLHVAGGEEAARGEVQERQEQVCCLIALDQKLAS